MILHPDVDAAIFAAMKARITDSAPPVICAWCPTFDRFAPANAGASHGICAACAAKLKKEM